MRCLWMLEEMGEPYQLIEKSTRADDLQSADYRRLNPNARIPTLVDGDLVLWELKLPPFWRAYARDAIPI